MKLTQKQALLMQLGIFVEALEILLAKRHDYSGSDDPFGNFRVSESTDGVPGWKGARIRNQDKFSRRRNIMESGSSKVADESFTDTLRDSVNYVCIEGGLEFEELEDVDAVAMLMAKGMTLPEIAAKMIAIAEEMS